jgi:hypothetical protein
MSGWLDPTTACVVMPRRRAILTCTAILICLLGTAGVAHTACVWTVIGRARHGPVPGASRFRSHAWTNLESPAWHTAVSKSVGRLPSLSRPHSRVPQYIAARGAPLVYSPLTARHDFGVQSAHCQTPVVQSSHCQPPCGTPAAVLPLSL